MKSKPSRFAIALEYDGRQAPSIIAKGHDDIANRILALAQDAKIPIHQDDELSHLLDQLDLGDHIPEALYIIIAEILTFAYRLSGKRKVFMDEIEKRQRANNLAKNQQDTLLPQLDKPSD